MCDTADPSSLRTNTSMHSSRSFTPSPTIFISFAPLFVLAYNLLHLSNVNNYDQSDRSVSNCCLCFYSSSYAVSVSLIIARPNCRLDVGSVCSGGTHFTPDTSTTCPFPDWEILYYIILPWSLQTHSSGPVPYQNDRLYDPRAACMRCREEHSLCTEPTSSGNPRILPTRKHI